MLKKLLMLVTALLAFAMTGCSSEDVPPAYMGRMFQTTGAWLMWSGDTGFTGEKLTPGTYFTGLYGTIKLVECKRDTYKETLEALTKNNVQFKLDTYLTLEPNCNDNVAFKYILDHITPGTDDKGNQYAAVSADQLYAQFARPAIGEAVREAIATYNVNDINAQRDAIFAFIVKRFIGSMNSMNPRIFILQESDLKLSHLDFPETLKQANVELAAVSIAKEKSLAEREKVNTEIETAKRKKELADMDGQVEAAKIDQGVQHFGATLSTCNRASCQTLQRKATSSSSTDKSEPVRE